MYRQSRIDWFSTLRERIGSSQVDSNDLIQGITLNPTVFQALKAATSRYVHACLGSPSHITSEEQLVQYLDGNLHLLANRTPNGVLMPKSEFDEEFTRLHGTLASCVAQLGITDMFDAVSCPVVVRVMAGIPDSQIDARRYSSSKLHVDLWTGDPGDEVIAFIPVLGDIEHTTVEFFEPSDDFEERFLKTFDRYEEAEAELKDLPLVPYRAHQEPGRMHFADAIVLHRTVRRGGRVRVSLDFRVRRKTSAEERAWIEARCDQKRLAHYMSVEEWFSIGQSARFQFIDTFANAQAGIFIEHPHNQRSYDVVAV